MTVDYQLLVLSSLTSFQKIFTEKVCVNHTDKPNYLTNTPCVVSNGCWWQYIALSSIAAHCFQELDPGNSTGHALGRTNLPTLRTHQI